MKKLLMALALAGASTVAITACGGAKTEAPESIPVTYKAQITSPEVYLEKKLAGNEMTDEELSVYVKQFVKISFNDEIADEGYTVSFDTNEIQQRTLGKYNVKVIVKFKDYSEVHNAIVWVVDRAVVGITETGNLPAFTPTLEMNNMPNYSTGLELKDSDGKIIDVSEAIANGKIKVDESTVRFSVPGTHIVKYAIHTVDGHTYNYYRNIEIKKSLAPTKEDFEKYFVHDAINGMSCRKDVAFPKNLLFPSKYMDGTNEVNVTKLKQWGCDFKPETNTVKENWRKVDKLVVDQGHKIIPDGFFALSQWDMESTADLPSIRNVYLPETLTQLTGASAFAGTSITSIIIPSSVERMDASWLGYSAHMSAAWKLRRVVMLGMPISKEASSTFGIDSTLPIYAEFLNWSNADASKRMFFYEGYMLGKSTDLVKNERFGQIKNWAFENGKYNLGSFSNFNKLILD